jgi:hypothetical protein
MVKMNPNELFKSIKAAADYKGNSNGRLSLWDIQRLHTRSENCLRYEAFNNGDTAEVLITIRDLNILLASYIESSDFLLHSYKPSVASTCLLFNVEIKSQRAQKHLNHPET